MGSEILRILSAALTPVIGLLALYIAYQQYCTNRYKYKLDLYDRRFSIYKGVSDTLSYAVRTRDFTVDEFIEFYAKIREVDFFFGKDISDFLEMINSKLKELNQMSSVIEGFPADDPGINQWRIKRKDLVDSLFAQIPEAKNRFMKYLKIER